MKSKKPRSKNYDKVFKENFEKIILPFLERRIGVKIISSTPIQEQLHSTMKREADHLRIVKTDKGEEFIFHLEFQRTDDRKMVYRIGEYHTMIQRKYPQLEMRHFVLYLGDNKPQMKTVLKESQIYRGFELIDIYDFDYEEFITSSVPEEIVLAILSDFDGKPPEAIIRLIFMRLKSVCDNENDLQKYIDQLNLLSQARKLDKLTTKIISDMPIDLDIRENAWYKYMGELAKKKGLEEGLKEGLQEGLKEGLKKGREEVIEKVQEEKLISIKKMLDRGIEVELIKDFLNVDETMIEEARQL